jgi:bifunctional UDP-N-acetylglucosamine pyrophosphorylase/glucosamine-1-phosphate N-acetyltransferase
MYSDLPKVAHPVLGRPMLLRVLETASACGFDEIITVVGHGREHLIPMLDASGFTWVVQEAQLGTAHAVSCAVAGRISDEYCILLGDVPLLQAGTVGDLVSSRREGHAAVAVLTARAPDPTGYGRVIRSDGDEIDRIVEERDATPGQRALDEVNTGLMAFDGPVLERLLPGIRPDNSQAEYYLTDCIPAARALGLVCTAVAAPSWTEVAGVNDQYQLAEASMALCARVVRMLMERGVKFPDPGSVWIEDRVTVGRGVTIGRNVRLSGICVIGEESVIGDNSVLVDAVVPPSTVVAPCTVKGPG